MSPAPKSGHLHRRPQSVPSRALLEGVRPQASGGHAGFLLKWEMSMHASWDMRSVYRCAFPTRPVFPKDTDDMEVNSRGWRQHSCPPTDTPAHTGLFQLSPHRRLLVGGRNTEP